MIPHRESEMEPSAKLPAHLPARGWVRKRRIAEDLRRAQKIELLSETVSWVCLWVFAFVTPVTIRLTQADPIEGRGFFMVVAVAALLGPAYFTTLGWEGRLGVVRERMRELNADYPGEFAPESEGPDASALHVSWRVGIAVLRGIGLGLALQLFSRLFEGR